MKTTKKIIFKINGKEVDSLPGEDITVQELDNFKIKMAFAHNVGSHDIEVVTEDVVIRELSKHAFISPNGLHFKPQNEYAIFREVKRIIPAFNIGSEEGFQKFLDMIFDEDFDNAITFD